MIALRRRRVMLAMLAAGFVSPRAGLFAAPRAPEDAIRFEVLRNGDAIGRHEIDFRARGGDLLVDVAIDLRVRFLFLPVYGYSHRNQEVWRDGRLIALDTQTDDNGTAHRVRGRAEGDVFVVEGDEGRLSLAPDILPTSYWHPDSMAREQWLDTQGGGLVRSAVRPVGSDTVMTADAEVDAQRYRLEGDLTFDIWYRDASWVGLRFDGPDGSTIAYRREGLADVGRG